MIEFRPYDLTIGEFIDKNTGETREIARIKSALAFDDAFIAELKAQGVTKYIKQEDKDVDTTGIL